MINISIIPNLLNIYKNFVKVTPYFTLGIDGLWLLRLPYTSSIQS